MKVSEFYFSTCIMINKSKTKNEKDDVFLYGRGFGQSKEASKQQLWLRRKKYIKIGREWLIKQRE